MQRLTVIAIALLGSLCFASSAMAKQLTVYSWVDKNGVAHFSYVEPSNKQGVRSFELKDHTSFGAEERKLEMANEKRSNEIDPLIARKQEYCNNAKHNLSVLENYDEVTQTDKSGQKVTIAGSDKEKYIKTAKQRIKAFCN